MCAQVPLDILIVDDESELRETLRSVFTREGHRVTTVADAAAATDRATTDRFDIVLLDVGLGDGPDGYPQLILTVRGAGYRLLSP